MGSQSIGPGRESLPYPIKGSPAFDTLAYHPVNERTNETTATKNGKVVMTSVIAVAKDGKITHGDADRDGCEGQEDHEQDLLRQGVDATGESLKR